jgi:hypothetical protein
MKSNDSLDALARALSQPPGIPDALRHEFRDIVDQTVHRLRSFLHQGKLKSYYFKDMAATPYHANSGPRPMPTA